jgi:hypothetical protein
MADSHTSLTEPPMPIQIRQALETLEGGNPTTTSVVYNFTDPDAATIVLAPGTTPSSSRAPIAIVRGAAVDLALQCWNRGGQASAFSAGDILVAAIYQRQVASPVCQPSVAWYTAGGTQTGYDQGQIVVSAAAAQTASLQPTGGPLRYMLVVTWTSGAQPSKSAPIVRLPLAVEIDY